MKICDTCKQERDLSDFYLRGVDGKPRASCNSCIAEREKQKSVVSKSAISVIRPDDINPCPFCSEKVAVRDMSAHRKTCRFNPGYPSAEVRRNMVKRFMKEDEWETTTSPQ